MDFENLFDDLIRIFEKHKADFEKNAISIDFSCFKEGKKSCAETQDFWCYFIRKIQVFLPYSLFPAHTFPVRLRKHQQQLSIILETREFKIKKYKESQIGDPFCNEKESFGFDIVLESENYMASWHLDRHIEDEDDGEGKYVHPIYHFTFGGHKMEEKYEEDDSHFENLLLIRSPRIMHPPLDAILGLDFIFKNFIRKDCISILDDKTYIDLIAKLKSCLWRPYAIAFSNSYFSNDQLRVDPNFSKAISGDR